MVTLFLIKEARIYNGEKTASSISGAGKTGQLHAENEIRTLPKIIHKNKLKMDSRPKYKTRHSKTLRGKHRKNILWHKSQQDLFWSTSYSNGNKKQNKQMGPNET